jgi:ribosomal protein S18 acetylase RimI-like enzyme
VLETDRIWSAYALADLSSHEAPFCEWLLEGESVVLIYRGLEPRVLFAHGDPVDLQRLFLRLPGGPCQYTLLGTHRALIGDRLGSTLEKRMWRMVLKPEQLPVNAGVAQPLGPSDLRDILEVFQGHADQPDAFHPRQLETGVYSGVREAGKLVSVAGTHVVSDEFSVAAIGNVFTLPGYRNRGMAKRATAAVAARLIGRGIRTVVLNVGMENEAAVRCYRAIGFWPFCGYYEGVGEIRHADAHVARETA